MNNITSDPVIEYYIQNGADALKVCKWFENYLSSIYSGECQDTAWDVDKDCDAYTLHSKEMTNVERSFQMLQISFSTLQR